MRVIDRGFFNSHSVTVAKKLIGKIIVKREKGKTLAARIVEVEAYRSKNDPGSHAYRRRTPRNSVMFGRPGVAYVYFCYGNHYLFNVVTEPEGDAGAVLIRAVEPITGIDTMKKRRKAKDLTGLTNGPGKWTQAFGIARKENGLDLCAKGAKLFIARGNNKKYRIASSVRIGIKEGLELKWRFYIKDNEFVSSV